MDITHTVYISIPMTQTMGFGGGLRTGRGGVGGKSERFARLNLSSVRMIWALKRITSNLCDWRLTTIGTAEQ